MKCEDIRGYLLTDYPDGQMNIGRVDEIERHLSSCVECREFSGTVCRSLVEPFIKARKISLSQEKVWHNISKLIKEEQAPKQSSNPFTEMIHRMRHAVSVNRPAFALFAIAITALTAIVYFNTINPEVADLLKPSESGAKSISYAADELSDHQSDDYVDYGTDIEKYFL